MSDNGRRKERSACAEPPSAPTILLAALGERIDYRCTTMNKHVTSRGTYLAPAFTTKVIYCNIHGVFKLLV